MAQNPQQIYAGGIQRLYSEDTISLSPGVRKEVYAVFNHFHVFELSGDGLEVIFGENQLQTPFAGESVGIHLDYIVRKLTLINAGASFMTIRYGVALGEITDSKFNYTSPLVVRQASPSRVTSSDSDVIIPAMSTAVVINTDPARAFVTISNLAANAGAVRLGDNNVGVPSGYELPRGASVSLETYADIYAYNPNALDVSLGVNSFEW